MCLYVLMRAGTTTYSTEVHTVRYCVQYLMCVGGSAEVTPDAAQNTGGLFFFLRFSFAVLGPNFQIFRCFSREVFRRPFPLSTSESDFVSCSCTEVQAVLPNKPPSGCAPRLQRLVPEQTITPRVRTRVGTTEHSK